MLQDFALRFVNLLECCKYDELKEALKGLSAIQDSVEQTQNASHIADVAVQCYVALLLQNDTSKNEISADFREFLLSSSQYDYKQTLKLLITSNLKFVLNLNVLIKFLTQELNNSKPSVQFIADCLSCDLRSPVISQLFAETNSKQLVDELMLSWTYKDIETFLLSNRLLCLRHASQLKKIVSFLDHDVLVQLEEMLDPFTVSLMTVKQLKSAFASSQAVERLINASPLSLNIACMDLDAQLQILSLYLFALIANKAIKKCHCSKPSQNADELRLLHVANGLAAGETHTAIATAESVTIWGAANNSHRVTGAKLLPEIIPIPAVVPILVTSVACGVEHTLALSNLGVYGWGGSTYGQVGVERASSTLPHPILLSAFIGVEIVSIACGYYHSLAVSSDFRLFAWGWGVHGQLANGHIIDVHKPLVVNTSLKVASLSAGYAHTIICTVEGEVWTCGCGAYGQLGQGDNKKRTKLVKVKVIKEPVRAIATKLSHCLAVTSSGRLYTWGSSPMLLQQASTNSRRMGNTQSSATYNEYNSPTAVDTSGVRGLIVDVFCGPSMSAFLTAEGMLYTWGKNYSNQLGFKDVTERKRPTHVTYLSNCPPITEAAIGQNYMVVCDLTGTLWGWGCNDFSQLGMINHMVPGVFQSDNSFIPQPRRLCALSPKVKDICGLLPPTQRHWTLRSKSDVESLVDWCSDVSREQLIKVVKLIVSFSKLLNMQELIDWAIGCKSWSVAAILCLQIGQRNLALRYHLMWCKETAGNTSDIIQLATAIVEFHFRLIAKAAGPDVFAPIKTKLTEMVQMCNEVIFYWCDNALDPSGLEMALKNLKDLVALPLLISLAKHTHPPNSNEDHHMSHCPVQTLSRSFLALISALVLQQQSTLSLSAENDGLLSSIPKDELSLYLDNCSNITMGC